MANWSKRRTRKAGTGGQRVTKTLNSKGTSTFSTSKKVGNVRTTTSTSSENGKTKIITTEHHPILGTRRTVQTLNKGTTVKRPKSKKPRKRRIKSDETYYGCGGRKSPFIDWLFDVSIWWWVTALALMIIGTPWYLWLVYCSLFLKFNVAFFK